MIGSTIAHYRVTAKLGEGGMGEVYRATDTKLDREVAIKVLPADFTENPERLARFEREAKLLAQLHHPNIASIFGLEESGGTRALVMELVEGPTLAERLESGALPFNECLSVSLQIAQALEDAHEKGIVHRDLKPQNVKASIEGKVKVLDFGLAKAMDPAGAASGPGSASQLAASPTLTFGATQMGVILGTAAYMSPEQAKGMAVDKRADIWAFGVVLYEMLTGRRLFEGDSVPETLAGVLKTEIDLGVLPAETPSELRRLLRRCLERNPKERLRDIGEARLALADLASGRSPVAATPAPRPLGDAPSGLPARPAIAAAVVVAVLAIGFLAGRASLREEPAETRAERRFVVAVEGRTAEDRQAISPDGARIAYTAAGGLWLRDLSDVAPRRLAGTDGAVEPFWSPDGRELGFERSGALWRLGLEGGAPKRICELPTGNFEGASWGDDGSVVFAVATGGWTGSLHACSATGGGLHTVHEPGSITLRAARPFVLPGGDRILFTLHDTNDRGEVRRLEGGVSHPLFGQTQQPFGAVLGPGGRLYYSLQRGAGHDLWSVRVDEKLEGLVGEPRLVAEGGQLPSVARDGSLVYAAVERPTWRLAWLERDGTTKTLGEPFALNADSQLVQIAPDGRRASVVLTADENNVGELWFADLETGARQRQPLDFEPFSAVWSPSGNELLVTGKDQALVLPILGSGTPRRLDASFSLFQPRFAPDGKWVVGYRIEPDSGRDLWRISADGGAPSEALLAEPGQQANPDVSPDGRLLAYQSDESGRPEIYVRPYPSGGRKWQVSTGGGTSPIWNRGGGELLWLADNAIWSTRLAPSGTDFSFGEPRRIVSGEPLGLELSLGRFFYNRSYDLTPEGDRFLVMQRAKPARSEVVLVENPGGEPSP
jgi:Tol biopolymer transport system component/aminoglycoside phosphotransferase (APT) family kinase protein